MTDVVTALAVYPRGLFFEINIEGSRLGPLYVTRETAQAIARAISPLIYQRKIEVVHDMGGTCELRFVRS